MPEPLAFLNGEYIPAAQARLPVYDLGVVQGATVVEHTRTFGGRPFRLDDHLDRLAHSLSLARIELPWSRDEIVAIGERLLANNVPLATGDLGLIHLATPGAAAPYNVMTGEPSRTGPT